MESNLEILIGNKNIQDFNLEQTFTYKIVQKSDEIVKRA